MGAWVTQSFGLLTLDFSSDHDLMVMGSSPTLGSVLIAWSLLGILSLSLSATPAHALSLSLKNKLKKYFQRLENI